MIVIQVPLNKVFDSAFNCCFWFIPKKKVMKYQHELILHLLVDRKVVFNCFLPKFLSISLIKSSNSSGLPAQY